MTTVICKSGTFILSGGKDGVVKVWSRDMAEILGTQRTWPFLAGAGTVQTGDLAQGPCTTPAAAASSYHTSLLCHVWHTCRVDAAGKGNDDPERFPR